MESKVVKMKKEKFDELFNLIGYGLKKVGFALVGLWLFLLAGYYLFSIEIMPE